MFSVKEPRHFHGRRRALGLCLAVLAGFTWVSGVPSPARVASALGGIVAAADGPTDTGSGPTRYALEATWRSAPWRLQPGHLGRAADVASSPDGRTVYVLDSRHGAVHVLARDGRARAVFRVPDPGDLPGSDWAWVTRRMDGAADGSLLILMGATYRGSVVRARVQRMAPDGSDLGAFERDGYHIDLAAGPDGRVYLARPYPDDRFSGGPGDVEVLDADGRLLARLGQGILSMPMGVDVAPDGTIHVLNRVPSPAGQPPPPATPLPSVVGLPAAGPGQAPAPEGIALFAADLVYRRTVPFVGGEDVAAGADAAFVSRRGELFRLGGNAPLYSAPSGQFTSQWFGGTMFRLAVTPDGGLLASMNHCYHQGLAVFDDVEVKPLVVRLHGELDRPPLEGPVFPLRVAAGEGLVVLQGRFSILDRGPEGRYHVSARAEEPQSVQLWQGEGELVGQLGLCSTANAGRDLGEVWWTRDVAQDGEAIYTADSDLVQRRGRSPFPDWTFWPGAVAAPGSPSRILALDADAGQVAVLDAGGRSVTVLGRDGQPTANWSIDDLPAGAVLGDVALSEDRVFLADRGRARVVVRGLDGDPRGEWETGDGPAALAGGPGGDVFVLGRSGWVYRFTAEGIALAAWPLPDRSLRATDITVGADGRVFVPFYDWLGTRDALGVPTGYLLDAGIWVFAPAGPSVPPSLSQGGCPVVVDKTAAPAVLPLGDEVTVRLEVDGICPDLRDPAQVMMVFDTSRSMNWDESLARAKGASLELVEELGGPGVEMGLVTFDDRAELALPLTDDLGAVTATLAGLEAFGDTRPGLGLDAALAELTGPRGRRDGRRLIVLVTDGDLPILPTDEAEAARAAGLEIFALAFPNGNYNDYHTTILARITGDLGRSRVLVEPDRSSLRAVLALAGLRRSNEGLFETIEVRDEIPANMRLVPDSIDPPARVLGRSLHWELSAVAAAKGLRLRYRLEPIETGTWPTNVEASADYRDAMGTEGQIVFPIPRVRVWDRASLGSRAYLPFLSRGACLRGGRPLDVILVLDTSESMRDPSGQGASKLDAARAAAWVFARMLALGQDRVAVIGFDAEARQAIGLTADSAAIRRALEGLTVAPGTRIDRGLAEAAAILNAEGRPAARAVIVLLTDGRHTGELAPLLTEAEALRQGGRWLFTIGLGVDVDGELLGAVARTPADYLQSPSAEDLEGAYRRVAERVTCGEP